MIRAVYACPSITDSSSFYRGFGPLTALCDQIDDLALYNFTQLDWANLRMVDVVFTSRMYSDNCVKACRMIRGLNRLLWIDYDDNFFCIPKHNPCYETLKNAAPEIMAILDLASVVTVSTEGLYKTYSQFSKNVQIIPNAYDDVCFGTLPYRQNERKKTIFWRGTSTHDDDLLPIAQQIVEVANSELCKDWCFVFMGHNPRYITDNIKQGRVFHFKEMDIIEYFNKLNLLMPAIMIVPLKDTEFNRSKSNIAWIEGTYSGAMTLASNLPEFRKPGVSLTDQDVFGRDLSQLIAKCNEDMKFIQEPYHASYTWIREELSLTKVNKKRESIILERKKSRFPRPN